MRSINSSSKGLKAVLTVLMVMIVSSLGWGLNPAVAQPLEEVNPLQILPPLENVIAQARLFSPQIAETKALLHKNEELMDRASKNWLDGISFGIQTTAGSYGNDAVDQINVGMTAAAGIRLSLFDIFSQRDQKKVFRWELEVSKEMNRKAEVEVEQYVVSLYFRVDLAIQQVEVQADSWRSAQVHREMAELEFANGDITVAELARVSEIEANSHSDYLAAVSEYRSWYQQLEVRIGKRLNELY
jgi:outer membrane protein TolC